MLSTDLTDVRPLLQSQQSQDPIFIKLSECSSVQSVINILDTELNNFKPDHVLQTIMVLWDLQRSYININEMLYEDSFHDQQPSLYDPHILLENYIKEINSHEKFQQLIEKVAETYQQFDLEALSCVLLYLTKMGVEIESNTSQKLIQHFESLVDKSEVVSMSAASRFLVAVHQQKGLYPILVSSFLYPKILEALGKLNN